MWEIVQEGVNPAGMLLGSLVMFFCLIWWINHKFEEILSQVKKK